MLSHLVHKVAS